MAALRKDAIRESSASVVSSSLATLPTVVSKTLLLSNAGEIFSANIDGGIRRMSGESWSNCNLVVETPISVGTGGRVSVVGSNILILATKSYSFQHLLVV